jgi:hypothetical protein
MTSSIAAEEEISGAIAASHDAHWCVAPSKKGPLAGFRNDPCGINMKGSFASLDVGNDDFIGHHARLALCWSGLRNC